MKTEGALLIGFGLILSAFFLGILFGLGQVDYRYIEGFKDGVEYIKIQEGE